MEKLFGFQYHKKLKKNYTFKKLSISTTFLPNSFTISKPIARLKPFEISKHLVEVAAEKNETFFYRVRPSANT